MERKKQRAVRLIVTATREELKAIGAAVVLTLVSLLD
jgi:hypothetical protein